MDAAGVLRLVDLSLLGCVVFIAWLAWRLPRLSRQDVYFAVTVDPGFRHGAVGRAVERGYRRRLAAMALAAVSGALALALAVGPGLASTLGLTGALLLVTGGLAWAFLDARRRVLPHARQPRGEAAEVPSGEPERLPGGLVAQLGPYALLAAAGTWVAVRWPELPERLVVHWNAAMEPDGWAERTPLLAAGPLAVGVAMCLLMKLIAYGLQRRTHRVHAGGAAGAEETGRRRAVAEVLLVAEYDMALVLALIGLTPLAQTAAAARGLVVAILALSTLGTMVLLVWLGLRVVPRFAAAQRSGETAASAAGPVGDRTADERWVLGVFYYNPDDPALLIEHRFGVGYTVNLARRTPWVVLALLVLLPLALLLMS